MSFEIYGHAGLIFSQMIKGPPIEKALICIKIFLEKQKWNFVKEIDTSDCIVAWAIYTSHTDKFVPKHTVFHCSGACLSVIFELLIGLIPFASKLHAG